MKSHATFLVKVLSAIVFFTVASFAYSAPVAPFVFVRITDTHIGDNGGHVPEDASEVEAVNALAPQPDFVINTGDLVDEGTASQYEAYRQVFSKLSVSLIDVPGNHDVRWSPLGKESFVDAMHEPMYRSFDHDGCHFVLLDSTVVLEHWGHFEEGELNWLRDDLKKTGSQTPVFLFFHHWVGRGAIQIDNEDEFFDVIRPYNVKIVFCGHGHSDIQWRMNGVQFVMERGLYQGSFDFAKVTPESVSLYRCRKEDNHSPLLLARVPMAPQTPQLLEATIRQNGKMFELQASAPGEPKLTWKVDGERSENNEENNLWNSFENGATNIGEDKLTPGLHHVIVRAEFPLSSDDKSVLYNNGKSNADPWEVSLAFRVESNEPQVLWSRSVGGTVQSRLLYFDGNVYVPCFDHKLYAFDAKSGKTRWTFRADDIIYSTPEINDGILYFGSADHFLYALNPKNGKLIWKVQLDGPVFAPPAVGAGVVCVGCGDAKAYGFDAKTGKTRWVSPLKGFVQAQAAFNNGAFYLGAWDNTFYALDAATGQLRWSDHIGRSMFYSPSIARPATSGSRVYVVSDDGDLHAIDQQSGHQDWKARCPVEKNYYGYSAPLILGDRLYVSSLGDAGAVDCLNADAGSNIWTAKLGRVIYDSSFAADKSRLYIGSVDGDLHCLEASTGVEKWTFRLGDGHLLASPATNGDDTVYIASMDDTVYALKTH